MTVQSEDDWKQAARLAGLALLVGLCCWASIALTRGDGRVAAIWLSNGLVVGLMLSAPTRQWAGLLAAGFCGTFTANLLASDSLTIGLLLTGCNMLEIAVAVWPLRRRFGEQLDLSTVHGLLYFGGFSLLLGPALSSLAAACVLTLHGGTSIAAVFSSWFPADFMGLLIVTPLVLALKRHAPAEGLTLRWRGAVLPWLLVVTASLLVFGQSRYPLLFLAFPPLLVLTYLQGLRGTMLGVMTLTFIALAATLLGSGPFMLIHTDSMQVRILIMQVFIAVAAAQGLVVGMLLAQRQRLTQELRLSEQRVRTITDSLPALIAHIDADERYHFVNAHVTTVFGVAPASLLGRTMREVRGEMIYADLQPHIARVLAGQPAHFENHGLAQGQHYHYQSNYIPEFGPGGRVTGFVAMTFDITERKNAELRQAADEERLRTITDNLPALITYFDPEGIYRFCNQTHADWFGKPISEWIGSHFQTVLDEPFARAQAPYIQRALRGERVDAELVVDVKGQQRTLAASYIPHIAADGRVLGVYKLMHDISRLKAAQAALHQQASHDALTGLANRREFTAKLEATIARNRPSGEQHALMFLDIDHFKHINDTHGHAVGDAVLCEVARRLQACVRHTDTVARLAGDEFVVILDTLRSAEESQFIARKIIAAMARPVIFESTRISVSLSIGIACDASSQLEPQELLSLADTALYQAKAAGRNTYRLAEGHALQERAKAV